MHQQSRFATVVPVAIILVVATIVIRVLNTGDDQLLTPPVSSSTNETSLGSIKTGSNELPRAVDSIDALGEVVPFRPINTGKHSFARDFPTVDKSPEPANEDEQIDRSMTSNMQPQLAEFPLANETTVNLRQKISNQHANVAIEEKPVSVFRRDNSTFQVAKAEDSIDLENIQQQSNSVKDSSFTVTAVDAQTGTSNQKTGRAFQGNQVQQQVAKQYRGLPSNIVNQALKRIEYGSSLARRGAVYGAHQEFVAALRSIAEACDIQQNTGNEHVEQLSRGLMALRETQDFARLNEQLDIGAALSATVSSHRSGVLDAEQVKSMNANTVLQSYFKFAQDKITQACGPYPISSFAFYSLGKLHTMNHKMNVGVDVYDQAKSIVMHRAALVADPNNFKSANELGVILAQSGQLEDAQKILQHGLAVHPTIELWNNLAVVHEQSGDQRLANAARNESQILAQSSRAQTQTHAQVQWVAPETFERNAQAAPVAVDQQTSPQQSQNPIQRQSSRQSDSGTGSMSLWPN